MQPLASAVFCWREGLHTVRRAFSYISADCNTLTLTFPPSPPSSSHPRCQVISLARGPSSVLTPRYYLVCPECENRFSKLYMPRGERLFACRLCHSLSYTSWTIRGVRRRVKRRLRPSAVYLLSVGGGGPYAEFIWRYRNGYGSWKQSSYMPVLSTKSPSSSNGP